MTESDEALQRRASVALGDGGVPNHYANGFVTSMSTGDVLIILERNGRPEAKLNLSYTIAKTLALSILHAVSKLEEAAGRAMLTTSEIESALNLDESDKKNDRL